MVRREAEFSARQGELVSEAGGEQKYGHERSDDAKESTLTFPSPVKGEG